MTKRSEFSKKTSDLWRSDPLRTTLRQVVLGRPTGDGTALSDVDGYLVLPGLGEQLADGRYSDAFHRVADVSREELCGLSGEHDANRMPNDTSAGVRL